MHARRTKEQSCTGGLIPVAVLTKRSQRVILVGNAARNLDSAVDLLPNYKMLSGVGE